MLQCVDAFTRRIINQNFLHGQGSIICWAWVRVRAGGAATLKTELDVDACSGQRHLEAKIHQQETQHNAVLANGPGARLVFRCHEADKRAKREKHTPCGGPLHHPTPAWTVQVFAFGLVIVQEVRGSVVFFGGGGAVHDAEVYQRLY